MPLRHAGFIVIWEGNYTSDIYYIGLDQDYLSIFYNLMISGICSEIQSF